MVITFKQMSMMDALRYTEENHFYQATQDDKEAMLGFKLVSIADPSYMVVSQNIIPSSDEIAIYEFDDKTFWHRKEEYEFFKALQGREITDMSMGYIQGTSSFLTNPKGMISASLMRGYEVWCKFGYDKNKI